VAASLDQLSERERRRIVAASSPLLFAEVARGFPRTAFHTELHHLLMQFPHLCVVAPREHGKSETVVTNIAWSVWRQPGLSCLLFSNTDDLASKLKRRIDQCIRETLPELLPRRDPSDSFTRFSNGSYIESAGIGATKRGVHPDVIVCDDILKEEHRTSSSARAHLSDWFHGSVLGMPHGGDVRSVNGQRRSFGPTRVVVLGTTVHSADLLQRLRDNPQFVWRRFAAEFDPQRLPLPGESLAVEVGPDMAHRVMQSPNADPRHRERALARAEDRTRVPSDQDDQDADGTRVSSDHTGVAARITSALRTWPR
jgi:hypothetical protein